MLLARKFARDFSERYSMPEITIEDSARLDMLHYRWPGNVRQLKNVVEQLALFHAGERITGSAIEQYLPHQAMIYAPTVTSGRGRSYEQERELLFNMMLRMQSEIDSLRKQLEDIHIASPMAQRSGAEADIIREPAPISRALVPYSNPDTLREIPFSTVEPESAPATPSHSGPTLEDTERETIRRSLENNGGRRKATARELNISERTLYRKIKEYGLE